MGGIYIPDMEMPENKEIDISLHDNLLQSNDIKEKEIKHELRSPWYGDGSRLVARPRVSNYIK